MLNHILKPVSAPVSAGVEVVKTDVMLSTTQPMKRVVECPLRLCRSSVFLSQTIGALSNPTTHI